ncbi:FitA-like ribbon-helix-helix domain-containing protein [Reyranella sp.]|uniref:FitA-like ribbon-helix-helix domain-containing protein n=1 Tax=Reyranella sp. TaxID=1929291 RepID=UPI003F72190E
METATAANKRGTTLTIRGLDIAIIDRLKVHARAKGRSLEADLRDLLTYASGQPLVLDPLEEADRIAAMTPLAAVARMGGGK